MIVKCKSLETYMFSPKSVREGYDQKTKYEELEINKEYYVYGTIMYEEGLRYLLYVGLDFPAIPFWYPAELFEITDHKVPMNWLYKYNGVIDGAVSAVWGYEELVMSDQHFDGLSEQEDSDIELFLKRKKEMY
ncbi:phosphoribosylaminoimidazole synthetase [Priestia flexa]|uniref:hypothetical protein n=1 Tax=Priestia flexa TaxID=86664 RepID=UPI000B9FA01C|nr:hypothetical protein CHN50_18435 [Priestia aryabhattai]